jgi:cell wall-associated NlpC family hydrolase
MTPTWFNSPERIQKLTTLCAELEGTPFFANSEAPGRDGGMDCVHALNYVFRTLGVIGPLAIPEQTMDHGAHAEHSRLIEAFETWPELRARFVALPDCSPANLLPGDVLCFTAGKVPHHGGLMGEHGHFWHTLEGHGWHRMQLGAAVRGWKILGALARAYRPLP